MCITKNLCNLFSYVLGSASQVLTAEGPEEQPVTLEYRSIVEQQLSEVTDCCCFSLSTFLWMYTVLVGKHISRKYSVRLITSSTSICIMHGYVALVLKNQLEKRHLKKTTTKKAPVHSNWISPAMAWLIFPCIELCHCSCCEVALIDYGCTGCMNDDITFVLGSLPSCDGQTFVSDITSSSQWSSAANLFVSRQTEG